MHMLTVISGTPAAAVGAPAYPRSSITECEAPCPYQSRAGYSAASRYDILCHVIHLHWSFFGLTICFMFILYLVALKHPASPAPFGGYEDADRWLVWSVCVFTTWLTASYKNTNSRSQPSSSSTWHLRTGIQVWPHPRSGQEGDIVIWHHVILCDDEWQLDDPVLGYAAVGEWAVPGGYLRGPITTALLALVYLSSEYHLPNLTGFILNMFAVCFHSGKSRSIFFFAMTSSWKIVMSIIFSLCK